MNYVDRLLYTVCWRVVVDLAVALSTSRVTSRPAPRLQGCSLLVRSLCLLIRMGATPGTVYIRGVQRLQLRTLAHLWLALAAICGGTLQPRVRSVRVQIQQEVGRLSLDKRLSEDWVNEIPACEGLRGEAGGPGGKQCAK